MSTRPVTWAAGAPTSQGPSGWSRHLSPILVGVRTGILGGTFDPIHRGHTEAAMTVGSQVALDRILFMPAGDPWQKTDRDVTPAFHRLEMTRLALEGVAELDVDRREIDRHGPTYTIDTLESFDSSEELFLIVGADAAVGISSWHRARDVLSRATVVVLPREGVDLESAAQAVPEAVFIEMKPIDISSTTIRQLVRMDLPFDHLVAQRVAAYIERNGLYADVPASR